MISGWYQDDTRMIPRMIPRLITQAATRFWKAHSGFSIDSFNFLFVFITELKNPDWYLFCTYEKTQWGWYPFFFFFLFFFFRDVGSSGLTGTVSTELGALTRLTMLWVLSLFFLFLLPGARWCHQWRHWGFFSFNFSFSLAVVVV